MSPAADRLESRRKGAVLVEQEIITSTAWLIGIRWWAGLGVLAATWFATTVLAIGLPALPLYAIGVGMLGYNAVFRVARERLLRAEPRRVEAFGRMTILQISLDYVAMAALIHFTGGLESPVILYFIFHIILAAILLSPRTTYSYTTLAVILISGTAFLEYMGLLPHVHVREFIDTELFQVPTYIFGKLFFFISTLYVTAFLGTSLNLRLRERAATVIKLSEDLQQAYSRLQTLYGNAQAANSTLELNQVLGRLVRATAEAMGVRACSIWLLDETGTRLHVAAMYGLSDSYVHKGDLVVEHNPLARQTLGGRTIITHDVEAAQDLQYPEEARAEGIRSMLTAPLLGKNKGLGLLRAYSNDLDHFSQEDAAFLTAIASQGSIAIENAMAFEALGTLEKAKSKFVLTVTHELRSPVSVIRSLLRTMIAGYTGSFTSEQSDMIGRALRRADFLQTLIDDLLDLAAQKGELHPDQERVEVRLDEAIERVLKQFQVPAQEKHLRLDWRCECGDRLISVSATREGIDRILGNLVSNAIKYTPPGGSVQVNIRRVNGDVYVDVCDTGIGIPEESLGHLFEEFYRAPNAKAMEKEGTGLGLAISRDLITRFGGRITVKSRVGKGTQFTMVLPTVRD